MTIGVLGPLLVLRDARIVDVRHAATAVVLSVLAASDQPVSEGRLDDVLALVVGGDAERRGTVPTTIWRLRRLLGADSVVFDAGFCLDRRCCETDVARFEVLLDRADATGDLGAAHSFRSQALALWRGPALPLLRADPEGSAAARRLEDRRAAAAAAEASYREHGIREGI